MSSALVDSSVPQVLASWKTASGASVCTCAFSKSPVARTTIEPPCGRRALRTAAGSGKDGERSISPVHDPAHEDAQVRFATRAPGLIGRLARHRENRALQRLVE